MKLAVISLVCACLSSHAVAQSSNLEIDQFRDWKVVNVSNASGSTRCFAVSQSKYGDVRFLLNEAKEIIVNFKLNKRSIPPAEYKIGVRIDSGKPWVFPNAIGNGENVSVVISGATGSSGAEFMRSILDGRNLYLLDNLGGVEAGFSLLGSGAALRVWHACATSPDVPSG